MHQVVTAQLAHRRRGTQSTKTRAEVRGGGRKPYRQKGTGNARQGSTRSPQFSGGGVALGPKPRSYSQKVNKKVVRLALASALSDRANDGKIVVVDSWGIEAPKTKDAVAALKALGIDGTVLIVVRPDEEAVTKSFRNLPDVQIVLTTELNAYDVLCSKWIVFSKDTVPVPSDKELAAAAKRAGREGHGAAVSTADEPARIKGNKDSMLYHVPGSRYYEVTKAEEWFHTEEEAEAAGYSKPGAAEAEERAEERSAAGGEGSASDEPHAARGGSAADDEPADNVDEEPADS
jgi:large subunit ribosomal protein L4